MNNAKDTKHVRISQALVSRGHSGTCPVVEAGTLPQTQPHIIVKLESDGLDIYAKMSLDVARNLQELLSINLK